MAIDRTVAIVGTAALATLVVASLLVLRPWQGDPFARCRSSVVAGGAGTIGGPFTLTDENGRKVTDAEVLARPALVYFGYTFCPDVCPLHMSRTADAVALLDERGHEVVPVFIAVDPDRDTPERLREWTDYLHPRMLGLTGTPDELREVAREYRAQFEVPEDRSAPDYLVGHSTLTYLMLPGHGFVEFYSGDTTAETMADSVACYLDAA